MESTAREFLSLLVQSRLFDQQAAGGLFEQWRASTDGQSDSAEAWRRWLVDQKLITEYQSSLLGRGHTEGHFLGQYRILDRIGRGRMAGVYRASDASGSQVAIKVLPPSKAKDPVLLARFQREARLAERLEHPNVVRARDVGAVNGFNYLVMEFLEGETLDVVLQRRGQLDVHEAGDLLEQALRGLGHVHEKRMVHRDVKPANMMLVYAAGDRDAGDTTGATLKLLDFGLSRAIDEFVPWEPTQDVNLTIAGALLGTPDYVAPEQARDARSADIRADIYSLGCVGYHLLSGHPPFPDKNAIRQMVRHATEAPLPLDQVRPETPAYLRGVIERMLAKNPADRFATPAEALEALQALAGETRSLQSAPSQSDSSASTKLLPVVERPLSAPSNFAGADAPTARQSVFIPAPAETTNNPNSSLSTPAETADEFERQFAVTTELTPLAKSAGKEKRKASGKKTGIAGATAGQSKAIANSGSARRSFYWTTRDTVVFACGAGTVLTALGIGALVSWLLHGK